MRSIDSFLTDRLDEDEHMASSLAGAVGGEWLADSRDVIADDEDAWRLVDGAWSSGVAEHIARYDPARALAEIAAKRAILAAIPNWQLNMADADYFGSQFDELLLLMVQPYADHPDFDPSWRL